MNRYMGEGSYLDARRGQRNIFLGVALAVADLLLILTIATFGTWVLHPVHPPSGTAQLVMISVIGILSTVAVGCAVLSWRLLTGRGRRSDGGLMSPFFLRLVSLGLAVGLVAALALMDAWSLWSLFEVAFGISLAVWAFTLARKREAQGAATPSESMPTDS